MFSVIIAFQQTQTRLLTAVNLFSLCITTLQTTFAQYRSSILIFKKQSSSNKNHNHNNHNNEIDQLKRDVRQALTSVRDIFRISQIKIKRKMTSPNSGNRILTRAEVEILVNPELKIRRYVFTKIEKNEKIKMRS